MAKDSEVVLTPDWYTLRVSEDGECTFKVDPPAPVDTTTSTKKKVAKDNDTGAIQAPEESMAPTEQVTEPEKPKPVKRKASPRVLSSRPSKTSVAPSSLESLRSSTSSWPPHRPSARTRKKTKLDIAEISDYDSIADMSIVSEIEATSTQLFPTQIPRDPPALPQTTVAARPPPFGKAEFSGRGWNTAATPAATTLSGNALSEQATKILRAPRDD
jgi:hypothetical protein